MLATPIEYVKGIGPVRAEVLKSELNIFTCGDLLNYFPFRYVDRTKFNKITELEEEMPYVQLRGVVHALEIVGVKHTKRLVVVFKDNTGFVELVWFKGYNYMAQKLKLGIEYVVFGKPSSFKGRINLAHPDIEVLNEESFKFLNAFQGVYNSTEKLKVRGLNSDGIRRVIKTVIDNLKEEHINENLSSELLEQHDLCSRFVAFQKIHFPVNETELKQAIFRIKFEELFFIQLKLLKSNKLRNTVSKGFVFSKVGDLFNNFFANHLPFQLTNAQKKVLKDIHLDLGKGRQMNRLIQGDVGSGKTMVALMSALLALDNGFQACLMAPTEILAQQHFQTFTELLKPLDIPIEILTGSTKTKKRKAILQDLQTGDLKLLIGTHALIEDPVVFNNLGLVVIDEQHRFGVAQRAKLHAKNTTPPHMLIMTATPIPRTLAMTLYGDLDVSVIDELPPGRKPIKTIHFTESHRLRVFGFMRDEIAKGRQIYVVFPLIEESEKMDYQNLQQGYDNLLNEFPPPNYQISIIHGKLSNEQKEMEMKRFIENQTQIMVATTVIEVGVNVPNASVMVIESAERFGLSQLHQLRGRVGRGAEQSYCVLLTGVKLSSDSKLRMKTMVDSNDGFYISEVDLKLRGPGDIGGTQQSGVMDLKLANLAQDGEILQKARSSAEHILNEDENLSMHKNLMFLNELTRVDANKPNWSKIG